SAYGLDGDPVPDRIDPDDYYAKRQAPEHLWDCFVATEKDLQSLDDDSFPAFRGFRATHTGSLPARLTCLGIWLAKICDQPAAIWWTAGQLGLHPDIQFRLQLQIDRVETGCKPDLR